MDPNEDLIEVPMDEVDDSTSYSYEEENKKQQEQKEKSDNKQQGNNTKATKGVIYVGHLPHGFYEVQLYKYFKQFGGVSHVKVARNTKVKKKKKKSKKKILLTLKIFFFNIKFSFF